MADFPAPARRAPESGPAPVPGPGPAPAPVPGPGPAAGRVHVLVMAKSPVAGRVKTRLCPPLSPAEAAEVAAAALADTLEAVARCGADRRVLALDGPPGDWIPAGFDVVAQRGPTFAARLAAAWSDAGGPGLQIGMDTPQVTPELIDGCLDRLWSGPATAVLGPAPDGGWWAVGLRAQLHLDAFAGVPMSTGETFRRQLTRLHECGHRVDLLPAVIDVDDAADAEEVAGQHPYLRFSRTWRRLAPTVATGSARVGAGDGR